MIYNMPHTFTLSEALVEFEELLPNIRAVCIANAEAVIAEHSPYAELNVDTPITKEAIHLHVNYLHVQQKLLPIMNSIRRIDTHRYYKQNPNQPLRITDQDIQNAKNVDENWFIQHANLSTSRPHKSLCFAHDDKNASLTLMKSKQSGHLYLKCFVCNKAWTSVSLLMDRDSMSFIEAVNYINR